MVSFDDEANQAVRQNNTAVIEMNEDKPTQGGNITKYSEIKGNDSASVCSEFTMPQFDGSTGTEFVALQLALDFEDFEGVAAAKNNPAEAKDATSGDAPDKSNSDDAALPAPEETEATGDKSKKEEKPAVGTKPSYSAIIDAEVHMVGICNKVHKKTVNVIQVLYIKSNSTANAMV